MALSPQKTREIVFLLLYSYDFSQNLEEASSLIMEELKVTKKSLREAAEYAQKILEVIGTLDAEIAKVSKEYDFQRIPRSERNILRLGVYELFFDEKIPPKVVISEGVRLARKFASFEAASFINAILDAIRIIKYPSIEKGTDDFSNPKAP